MGDEIQLARLVASGIIHIFTGKVITRIVGFLGGIVLIRLLKPEEYGLIYIATFLPNVLMLFNDFGIDTAITKYLSEYRSKNEIGNLRPLFYSSLAFKIALNCVLTALCFLIAETFASVALGKTYLAPLMQAASLFVLAWALNSFSRSVFLGLDATKSYAIFEVINEILLSSIPILLVLYGLGAHGALLGMVVASLIASLIGIIYSVLIIRRMTKGLNTTLSLKLALRRMLEFGIPLLAVIFSSVGIGHYYRFMLVTYVMPHDLGNYSVAEKPLVSIDYLAFPVSAVLFPTFSKIKDLDILKKALKHSVKYSSFLILPLTMVMMILAYPLVIFLFGIDYEGSWIYLSLLAISWLTYGLGGVHVRKLLLSQGKTEFIAKLDILTAIIGVITGFLLIPPYGVIGLIITSSVAGWPSYFVMIKKSRDEYGIKPPLMDIGRLYMSIAIAGAVVTAIALMPLSELPKLVLGGLTCVATYLISVVLTKAIDKEDINRLREMIKPQPVINVMANKLFDFMERIAKLKLKG